MVLILLRLCCAFFGCGEPGDFHWDDRAFVSGSQLHPRELLEESWFVGSGLSQVISNCSTMFLLLWQQKLQNEFCHKRFHAKSLCLSLRLSSFWNPQISLQFLHCQLLIFVDCSPYTFKVLKYSAYCRPCRTWITFNRFTTIFKAFVPYLYLRCTHCIIPKSLLNHLNSFHGGMFKVNAKSDAESLLYSFSHFECVGQSIRAHLMVSTAPTDQYGEVIIVQACAFHFTLLGCQVTLILHKLVLLH